MSKDYTSVKEPYNVENAFEEARRMLTDSHEIENTRIYWNDPIKKEGVVPSVLNRAENLISLWYINNQFEDVN